MNRPPKQVVIAIAGPTASGKTALSLKVSKRLGCEIIACDSRTVYKEFDIGTAKPTKEEQEQVQHHLIDVAEPTFDYTSACFKSDASVAIKTISERGQLPLVVGGTGFYFRCLLEGLSIPEVPPQKELRQSLNEFADLNGNQALHDRLKQVDQESALRLNANDRFRIVRALEVFEVTGTPMSRAATRVDPPYRTIWIGLNAEDRSVLTRSIERRMQQQMNDGLLEETQRLLNAYGRHQKLMHTVNYKELVMMLSGEIDREEALKLAIRHNSQLSRRQLIWFRANKNIKWFAVDALSGAELTESVIAHIKDAMVL